MPLWLKGSLRGKRGDVASLPYTDALLNNYSLLTHNRAADNGHDHTTLEWKK